MGERRRRALGQLSDLADAGGYARSSVRTFRGRHDDFPHPVFTTVSGLEVWDVDEFLAWDVLRKARHADRQQQRKESASDA